MRKRKKSNLNYYDENIHTKITILVQSLENKKSTILDVLPDDVIQYIFSFLIDSAEFIFYPNKREKNFPMLTRLRLTNKKFHQLTQPWQDEIIKILPVLKPIVNFMREVYQKSNQSNRAKVNIHLKKLLKIKINELLNLIELIQPHPDVMQLIWNRFHLFNKIVWSISFNQLALTDINVLNVLLETDVNLEKQLKIVFQLCCKIRMWHEFNKYFIGSFFNLFNRHLQNAFFRDAINNSLLNFKRDNLPQIYQPSITAAYNHELARIKVKSKAFKIKSLMKVGAFLPFLGCFREACKIFPEPIGELILLSTCLALAIYLWVRHLLLDYEINVHRERASFLRSWPTFFSPVASPRLAIENNQSLSNAIYQEVRIEIGGAPQG